MERFRPANIAKVVLALGLVAAAVGYMQVYDDKRTADRADQRAEATRLAARIADHQRSGDGDSPTIGSDALPGAVADMKVLAISDAQLNGDAALERTDHFGYRNQGSSATLLAVSFDRRTDSRTASERTAGSRAATHTWHVCTWQISAGKVDSRGCDTRTDRVVTSR